MEHKDFDAVDLMRKIRTKLHAEYEINPELRKTRLHKIRKKYSSRIRTKELA